MAERAPAVVVVGGAGLVGRYVIKRWKQKMEDSIIVAADGQTGGSQAVRKSDVRPFYDSGEETTFQDNTEMVHLDDANILDNLRKRYCKDKIYTYTANVLLAVNPYKSLRHLYTREEMEKYWGKNPGTLPPHPYAIADVAYRRMQRDRKNQALVISGESGAGKTETAKITMHYLTSMSRTDVEHGNKIQDKIISANPILESFGNASTVMNMNSSRFGKYNEMMFDRVGSLVGAGIKTFLLESSRVVVQQHGEKNYHVFYELLAGMDDDHLDNLSLDREENYKLLHSSGTPPLQEGSPESQRLAKQFEELKHALSLFVGEEEQDHMWDILGALIHLGEVEFEETVAPSEDAPGRRLLSTRFVTVLVAEHLGTTKSSQTARVAVTQETEEALETAADLLGLTGLGISRILKFREMRVNRQGRTSHIKCPRSLAQAKQTLQCIIKVLYKRMFDKIVAKINEVSNARVHPDANYTSIGTLDIYGFERLEHNSFEQLCINLANERLQQFFVEEAALLLDNVLQAEQRMYEEERLTVLEMDLPDSTPVVLGVQNVMKLLDEHSLRAIKNLVRTGPKDDKDAKYCEQVHRELIRDRQGGPVLPLKLKASRSGAGPGLHDGFQICHYAGPVSYSTRGWIDKNNDSLVPEIESLLADGSKDLVTSMADTSRMSAFTGERLCSVSSTYLNNLNDLLSTLKRCSVHYVRCFNPNQERKPGLFNRKYVLEQVIQCGTVELVRIMHYGYPHRCILRDLRARFQQLLPPEFAHYSDRNFMHAVMLAWDIDESQWLAYAKLISAGQLRALEDLRDTGGQASQAVIRRIRKQFSLKKARAYAHAVEFCTYLHKVMRAGKRERNLANLYKAIRIMVQLNRWKNRALRLAMDDETESLFSRPLGIPFETMALEVSNRRVPQLFLTMAGLDMPKSLAPKLGAQGPSNEDYERLWQTEAKESVLYFHDGVLKPSCMRKVFEQPLQPRKSAKLCGGAFLGNSAERALCDVRRVDCISAARCLLLSTSPMQVATAVQQFQSHGAPSSSESSACASIRRTAACLHTASSRAMSTPSSSGNGLEQVLTCDDPQCVCFSPPHKWQIYQLCFLPNVGQPGEHVLAVLGRMRDCHWLAISIYSVSRDGRMRLHSIKKVLINLLAGSKNIELRELEGGADCESHILKLILSRAEIPQLLMPPQLRLCPLPMEPGSHGGFLDWIWLGLSHSVETNRSRRALNFNPMHACVTRLLAVCSLCLHSVSPAVNKQKCCCMLQPRTALFRSISPHCHRIPESGNGEMFGILVEESWEGLLQCALATFSKPQGVPIHTIVAVSQPTEWLPAVKVFEAHNVYYSLTMRRRDVCPNVVLSMGADGKLLRTERCAQTHQWVPSGEWALPLPGKSFAIASSALLPSLLLLAPGLKESLRLSDVTRMCSEAFP
ncbi:jar [Symbiodinium natans]|uniref:Jar protein n=1 Tax=Symbiodinium natans TaxID=878477 RepID=A0A812UDB9_9DINO|nr:jar [Symbiodinium natans]